MPVGEVHLKADKLMEMLHHDTFLPGQGLCFSPPRGYSFPIIDPISTLLLQNMYGKLTLHIDYINESR